MQVHDAGEGPNLFSVLKAIHLKQSNITQAAQLVTHRQCWLADGLERPACAHGHALTRKVQCMQVFPLTNIVMIMQMLATWMILQPLRHFLGFKNFSIDRAK